VTDEVNVTNVPGQIVLAEGVITILTGNNGLMIMVIWFEVAGLPSAQVAVEVSTHVTILPLEGIYV
jgi:hypothetical protein